MEMNKEQKAAFALPVGWLRRLIWMSIMPIFAAVIILLVNNIPAWQMSLVIAGIFFIILTLGMMCVLGFALLQIFRR